MTSHAQQDIEHHQVVAPHYDELVNEPRKVLSGIVFRQMGALISAKGGSMLDLGAGTGNMSARFGERFERVVLVDHSRAMLDEAQRNTTHLRERRAIVCADALVYVAATPERFDFIACVGFLHHLEPDALIALFRDLRRVLRPGGAVLLAEPVRSATREPALIAWWNRSSIPKLRRYLDLAPTPDEAPLHLDHVYAAAAAGGFEFRYERRTWEIFTRRNGDLVDRVAIRLLDRAYGKGGVVWFGLVQ
jgi:SAM-dependent methyltransferase